ncbi:GNAT family N-acetyltransferase [Metabacillus halosaccharovorans]|uniref:GNAT family N-acetyltransferase n=1 Tax=Metabacillus halosaccharovorans TaxID=930124 RepID=UPI001C1F4551|nr:GNAT family N-acetyltransferase [Metabacillus halosaccharovorans]MBU7592760.1 GNAT family N-acetyltransferase [Metabacillus halosaccharovorans]
MFIKRVILDEDLKAAFTIRKQVFVEEQSVPLEDEFDQFDTLNGLCEHILVHYNEQPVGTGRLRVVGGVGKLERICILKPFRKFGLGKVMIKELEEIAKEKGVLQVKLHGQTQAEGFYKKLGYQTSSPIFMEDGIPHILMEKELSTREIDLL